MLDLELTPEALYAAGAIPKEIADRLNAAGVRTSTGKKWTADSVGAHLARRGLRRKPIARQFTPKERERIATLAREGLPVRWIAEDVGGASNTVQRVATPHRPDDATKEWKTVWGSIMKHPELVALHREFAPQGGRALRSRRKT